MIPASDRQKIYEDGCRRIAEDILKFTKKMPLPDKLLATAHITDLFNAIRPAYENGRTDQREAVVPSKAERRTLRVIGVGLRWTAFALFAMAIDDKFANVIFDLILLLLAAFCSAASEDAIRQAGEKEDLS